MKVINVKARKLFIVVDMNNGFVKSGNMADPNIQHITPECEKIVCKALEEGYQVMYVTDWHKKNCSEFYKFPVHCVEGTDESEMVDALKKYQDRVIVIKKNSTSAMFAPGFMDIIKQMVDLEEVLIMGCCTDICVLNLAIPLVSYFDEEDRNVKVTVPMNAVETYDAPWHPREEYNAMAFKFMKQTGINIVERY